ncbi:sulfurtransferase [Sphingomonas sp. MMS12-HWE2-04]|uniref:sulfurtransferase n=1 Tax=Sphingomonas sp. MMS12-HWE2-04 TaxID=3234199 RepID=UPI00384D0BF9
MEALVTTQWLAGALGSGDLLVLDASYTSTIPGAPPSDPRLNFERAHIPGARYLDLDTLIDAADPLPSMLPPRALFEARMAALGVTPETRVVLYDNGPHHTACRAWWVLGRFGVEASLLDGGLAKWLRESLPVQAGPVPPASVSSFTASAPRTGKRTLAEMRANLESGAEQVVDARSAARFTGEEPDPRKDCAAGHIPGAKNIPYGHFFTPEGTWKTRDAIAATFAEAGIDPAKPLVTTCGSGITAAIIAFAAHLLGHHAALYDGSWSEWGAEPATPKAMGPA